MAKPNPDRSVVLKRITVQLKAAGKSQAALERTAGLAKGMLSHFFKSGDRAPNARDLKEIGEALEKLAPRVREDGEPEVHPADMLLAGTSYAETLRTGDLSDDDLRFSKVQEELAKAEARAAAETEKRKEVENKVALLEADLEVQKKARQDAEAKAAAKDSEAKGLRDDVDKLKADVSKLTTERDQARAERATAQSQLMVPLFSFSRSRPANVKTWSEYALLLERRNDELTDALQKARQLLAQRNNAGAASVLGGIAGLMLGAVVGAVAANNGEDDAPRPRRRR